MGWGASQELHVNENVSDMLLICTDFTCCFYTKKHNHLLRLVVCAGKKE